MRRHLVVKGAIKSDAFDIQLSFISSPSSSRMRGPSGFREMTLDSRVRGNDAKGHRVLSHISFNRTRS